MALACLACHAMDNSTDSFRMDSSFRARNMSVRSEDGQEGCGGVAACFSKNNSNSKTAPLDGRQLRQRQHPLGGRIVEQPLRGSAPSAKESLRGGGGRGGGGAMASFGRHQQPAVSVEQNGFLGPRLTRCHAVRRDLFNDWTLGEIENEFGGRQMCFNLSSTTA